VSGYSWYYFCGDRIFGSHFSPAALTALEILPQATEGGLMELVAWVTESGYYLATQERGEQRTPGDWESAVTSLEERMSRHERVLSVNVEQQRELPLNAEQEGELPTLEKERLQLNVQLMQMANRCQRLQLMGFWDRLQDQRAMLQNQRATHVDSEQDSLRAWIAETESLLIEATGAVERAEAPGIWEKSVSFAKRWLRRGQGERR
jgi:hypothetical protein